MQINKENIETWCLLYVDNALTSEEKAALEAFIATDNESKILLESYVQTIVPVEETIVFEDKALLYRFDALEAQLDNTFKKQLHKTSTTLIPLWAKWSVSVAAILLIIFNLKNVKVNNNIAPLSNTNHNPGVINFKPSDVLVHNNDNYNLVKDVVTVSQKPTNTLKMDIISEELINNSPSKDSSVIALRPIESERFLTSNAEENKNVHPSIITSTNLEPLVTDATETNTKEPLVQTIIEEDNDHLIYVGALEINSDKLRGVTRRINAFLKKTKITDKD